MNGCSEQIFLRSEGDCALGALTLTESEGGKGDKRRCGWVGLLQPICGLHPAVAAFLACDIFGFSVSVRRTDNDDESTSLHKGRAERERGSRSSVHPSIYRIELCNMACSGPPTHASKCCRASGRMERYLNDVWVRANNSKTRVAMQNWTKSHMSPTPDTKIAFRGKGKTIHFPHS